MNYMLYTRQPEMKTFKAVDLKTGYTVSNLVYATLIPERNLELLKEAVRAEKTIQPESLFQIRKAGTSQTIFSI